MTRDEAKILIDKIEAGEMLTDIELRSIANRMRLDFGIPNPNVDTRHRYRAHRKYPWFCADCGYPEHETLKHFVRDSTYTDSYFKDGGGHAGRGGKS